MAVAQKRELLDVRKAAGLVDRHPETIRRWIWSGKLASTRAGNRLMVEREAVLAASGERDSKMSLAEWADKAREVRGLEDGRAEWDIAEQIREDREARARHLLDLAGR